MEDDVLDAPRRRRQTDTNYEKWTRENIRGGPSQTLKTRQETSQDAESEGSARDTEELNPTPTSILSRSPVLLFQIPHTEIKNDFMQNIPTQAKMPPDGSWVAKKTVAAEEAVKEYVDSVNRAKEQNLDRKGEDYYTESDDSQNSDHHWLVPKKRDGVGEGLTPEQNFVVQFIGALPDNLFLDIGFFVTGRDKEWCYCPCSKKMLNWQKLHNVRIDEETLCDGRRFFPQGLLDHLRDVSTNKALHRYTRSYLTKLHANYMNGGQGPQGCIGDDPNHGGQENRGRAQVSDSMIAAACSVSSCSLLCCSHHICECPRGLSAGPS